MSTSNQTQALADNVAVLANIVDLSNEIVMRVAGNDASDVINGKPVSVETLTGLNVVLLGSETKRG